MAGDPYRATGGSEGHSTRHRETANDAYQLGVELRWRQDQGKSTLLRHAVFHAAARHIATVMAMCRHSPPHGVQPTARSVRSTPGSGGVSQNLRILLANSKVPKLVHPTCFLGRQKSLGN